MRVLRLLSVLAGLGVAACREDRLVVVEVPAPENLSYRLEPSGDPDRPAGILLAWEPVDHSGLTGYRIYSRGGTSGPFGLRGETSSNTFHDNGEPHLEYYVVALGDGGFESDASNRVTVDERLALERPTLLSSISLNGAIHLSWTDNAFEGAPDRFEWYRIYSVSYDLDTGFCDTNWALEGATVAPEFLAGALDNGRPRCFGVSAISREGYESLWSPVRQDTPRPDARNTLVFALGEDPTRAGFRFWDDANNDGVAVSSELGIVTSGNATDIDFRVTRDATDTLWIEPVFAGTRMQLYDAQPVADLTSIDFAPASGYSRSALQAIPTYGYVFEIVEGTTLRYGALRVTHAGRDYVIFDWSLQTDRGNPELIARR